MSKQALPKNTLKGKSVNVANTLFLLITPVMSLVLGVWYTANHGFVWQDALNFFFFYFACGLSVTGGYHRLIAHRAYDVHPLIKFLYLVFGAGTFENSALRWCRDHRIHHQYVDQDKDPYNIKKGFWWAHMGWIFYKDDSRDDDFSVAPDLVRDGLIQWQERWYLPLALLTGFVLPTLVGYAYGRPFAGFLWGGLIRVVAVHHFTFTINSLAHMLGDQPYSTKHTARDSWITALVSYGEGYHNYHHTFAADYRNGVRWWQYDPTKWMINLFNWMGLVQRMTRFREEHIRKAQLQVQAEHAKKVLAQVPSELRLRLEARLAQAQQQYESALRRWEEAKVQLAQMRSNAERRRDAALKLWKLKTKGYHLEFQTQQVRWAMLMAAVSRVAHNPHVHHFLS